jgi:hypothetical protein
VELLNIFLDSCKSHGWGEELLRILSLQQHINPNQRNLIMNTTTQSTAVTYVVYRLKGEDYTGTLVSKAGLFWMVRDEETGEEKKIPAKCVEETYEESDEAEVEAEVVTAADLDEEIVPATPVLEGLPSLAEQAAVGPVITGPGDTITLAQLCADQGVEPRIARRQLRAAVSAGNYQHTGGEGWTFSNTPESIELVMSLITARKRG